MDQIQKDDAAKDPFYQKVIDSQRAYAALVLPYQLSYWPTYEFRGHHDWKESIYLEAPPK